MRACLKEGNLSINDIDLIITPGETYKDIIPRTKLWVSHHFGYSPEVEAINHQTAHIASSFFHSGFDEAMCLSYDSTAPKSKVSGEIFNVGYENSSVIELANIVKKSIGDDVVLKSFPTDDNRSYHISSKKIKNILTFESEFTIKDAVCDLKEAFEKKLFSDPLNNHKYFNIKTMQLLNLK